MGFRRGRSRSSGSNVREFVTNDLCSAVGKLMDNRRRLLAPFPLSPDDIYELAWSREELQAMHILKGYDRLMNLTETVIVRGLQKPHTADTLGFAILHLPEPRPAAGYRVELKFSKLPEHMRVAMGDWAALWQELWHQQCRLLKQIEEVGTACNTYGQVYRLWPDLLGFFGPRGKEKINSAQMKSKLPDSVLYSEWHEEQRRSVAYLKAEFRPEVFEPFSNMIAECLMLPTSESKEIATLGA